MNSIKDRLAGLSLGLLTPMLLVIPQQSVAQEDAIEEIVTTGTRSRARSVEDSPAPVDVLSADYFTDQGDTDLVNLVRNIVPSYNVNSQPISDAATIVRPANLRGLAPDHTLVLINGKRRHRAAVIYWLGNGVADGAQGPDISAIPSIALKQVEVLRDGAAAQYGSDAIAGVMNFILKDDAEGATLEAKFGEYSEGDGQQYSVSGNIGLPLSDAGFANFSFEYGESDPTDRSVQRNDAAALIAAGNTDVANPAQIWGSPEITNELKLFANLGLELGGGSEAYMHGNMARKHVDGGFYFRNPTNRGGVFAGPFVDSSDGSLSPDQDPDTTTGVASVRVGDMDGLGVGGACPAGLPLTGTDGLIPDADILAAVQADDNCWSFVELFPGGFTPRFGGDVRDAAIAAGVRGETDNGLRWDVSAGYGFNDVDFFINNTVNASLGPATPVEFDPGDYTQSEQMLNVDFAYSPTDNTNLAFGAEWRNEVFEITVGQEESFTIGPLADQGFSAASNGFPGFSNITGGDWDRKNISLYVDGEWEPMDNLLLAAAVRYEDFDDFGTTTNYKVAGNLRVTDNFGLRGTVSTGFKAPTPGQSNAFNVSTEFDLDIMDLVNNGTVPSTSGPALLRGGKPLEPEESTNFTVGTFFNVGGLDVTVDFFQIEVDDRLSLTQDFALTPAEVDQLIAEGITSAGNLANFRFFANDFDTETKGIDVVATYPVEWGSGGDTVFSLAFNNTTTEVTRASDAVGATRIQEYEEGLPETRYNVSANHSVGDWRFLARVSYYDDWFDSEDGNTYDGKSLVDLEAAYTWNEQLMVVIGAQNAFDETPDENP
ncbi:MAG: TonB-dependent receptor, partial [Gammaproteobacteria bacterium]|nr:TonB-dependent receptor [Gammaproteobacteria bacterium]